MICFRPLYLFFSLFLFACTPIANSQTAVSSTRNSVDMPTATKLTSPIRTVSPTQTISTPSPKSTAVSSQTATATSTVTARPTNTATSTPTKTATPSGPCRLRIPDDGLLTLLTKTYGISGDFEPADIIAINDYLPYRITLGAPSRLREVAIEPLVELVNEMEAAGLRPQIVSGYRDFYEQTLAYEKWAARYPDRVDAISARPGHSEHQLGTTIDFTSPELPSLTGNPELQFHPFFSQTSEGGWLAENAHKYGFTLSYPTAAFELTGFHYEPWHFRYIGIKLATRLQQLGISFTEYQLLNEAPPCWPHEE